MLCHDTPEEWRSIPSLPKYEVSSHGRVRAVGRGRGMKPGRILRQHIAPEGYPKVFLSEACQNLARWVHRLVAEAFLGPCPDGMNVNHEDFDKAHNCLPNLSYVTYRDNHLHAIRMGRRIYTRRVT